MFRIKALFALASLLFLVFQITAQYNPNSLPNTYRSSENPFYWKNKIPTAGYWQQDVAYEMDVRIDDSLDVIFGNKYKLTYWNNSPDTLKELYFHVYQNAFVPNSHMHDLYKNNEQKIEFGKHEKLGLGTVVDTVLVAGKAVKTMSDNTVFKVILNTPLLPSDSLEVDMVFRTFFDKGTLRRRMKIFDSNGQKHYDGVHWYPTICVYDRKFKWTTEQHLDKEFYNNLGTFDVKLTFPEKYVVDATGTLQNRNEVLPDTLRAHLDLKKYKKDSIRVPAHLLYDVTQAKTKTWHFYAENVHNFAFTADPNYRIGETSWNGIKVIALAQEKNAHLWQQSAEFTRKVIKTYSTDFGMYMWPKIIVADADDGMEYPMLTLDGGSYPGHQGLLAHEVGHMWFYGMIGSNETYRAFLDEGFTQFLTVWSMDKITGREKPFYSKNKHISKSRTPTRTWYSRMYYPYMKYTTSDCDMPLNTHSSDFNSSFRHGGAYGLVYFKTAVMLSNLQQVLGDTLFLNAMKHYFNTWKCAHPYPEDFRNAIADYTKTDLNWFFDQWLETTKTIDYKVRKVKYKNDSTEIELKRVGEMQMPLQVEVVQKSGDTSRYYIPNTWFEKETSDSTLPKWYGWGKNLHPTYSFKVKGKVNRVEIDPSLVLADVNRTNNVYAKTQVKLDPMVRNTPVWDNAEHFCRPDVWYNKFDGLQLGLNFNGNYFQQLYEYDVTVWGNTRLGQYNIPSAVKTKNDPLSFDVKLREKLKLGSQVYGHQQVKWYGGVFKTKIGLEKIYKPQKDLAHPKTTIFYVNATVLKGPNQDKRSYLFYDNMWSVTQVNSFLDAGFTHKNVVKKHQISVNLRSPFVLSDFNYSYLELVEKKTFSTKKSDFHFRAAMRLGAGNTPIESSLFAAGKNPEALFENRLTSANGILPSQWMNFNTPLVSYQEEGGLNLRGYAGDLISYKGMNYVVGKNGASVSLDYDFQRLFGIKRPNWRIYAFADAGVISTDDIDKLTKISPVLADGGFGFSKTFRSLNYKLPTTTVGLVIPVWVNYTDPEKEKFVSRGMIQAKIEF